MACECCNRNKTYYWREYFGTIPEDAVVAGRNLDGSKIYIGQGFVFDIGVVPGRLLSGSKTMNVGSCWKNFTTSYIKVLCGPQENFYWMPATSSNLHVLLGDRQAVIGGYQAIYKLIGRVNIGGNLMVGKIDSLGPGNAPFYYADGNKEIQSNSYEVLLYSESEYKIDPR